MQPDDTDSDSDTDSQTEMPFAGGNLRGLPWAAIIITATRAQQLEESGEIEWTGDFYRQCDDPTPEAAITWLAAISQRLENLRLDPFDYRVLAHLVWRSGNRGTCWPTYDQIAAATGISRRRIAMALRTLVGRRLITFVQGRTGVANSYTLDSRLEADPLGPVQEMHWLDKEQEQHPTPPPTPHPQPQLQHHDGNQTNLFGEPDDGTEAITPSIQETRELFAFYLPATLGGNTAVMLALGRFEKSRREARKKMTPTGIATLCRKIKTWDPEDIIAAADQATEAGWLSIYPPKDPGTGKPAASQPRPTGSVEAWAATAPATVKKLES